MAARSQVSCCECSTTALARRAEIVNRLFEPFATSKPEGIGLGLAVARQIAESHGGRIVFQHADGETCFEVILPAAGSAIESRAKPQAVCSTET